MKRPPLPLLLLREHHYRVDQSKQSRCGELECVAARPDERRGPAAVKVENDRATTPPDNEDGGDVPRQRSPIVRRFHNGDVENLVLQRAAHRDHVSNALGQFFEERLVWATLPPRMRNDCTVEGAKGPDEMRREFWHRATGARTRDEHDDAHQSTTPRPHTFTR